MSSRLLMAACGLLVCAPSVAQAVTFDWVAVGNPGNGRRQGYASFANSFSQHAGQMPCVKWISACRLTYSSTCCQ